MTNDDPDLLVRRFVDGDLPDAEVGPALHRIADDAEARSLLQFELRVTQDLAASRSAQPAPGFAERTMEAVAAEDEAAPLPLLRWLWNTLTTPVALDVRPASAAMALFFAGVVAWTVWPMTAPGPEREMSSSQAAQTVQQAAAPSSADGETVWIRFRYTDNEADSVAVAGDFSQWDPVPLTPRSVDGQTVWTGLVPMSRGEHEYQFLIDGERWVTDPLAPVQRSDGFGAKNAVLNI